MTNYNDMEKKSEKELETFIAEKREEIRHFRFGVAGAGTRDVKKAKTAKKEIARALTALNLRSNEAAKK